MTIKILLVDDDKLTRDGVKANLMLSGLFTVVGEADNGADGLRLLETLQPDIVIFDISMPVMNGQSFATRILNKYPQQKRVVLTSSRHTLYLQMFLYLKVNGYLHKSITEPELRESLLGVMKGDIKISVNLDDDPDDSLGVKRQINQKANMLTPTERKILQALLVEGGTNEHLADYLQSSVKSVSFHLSNVYKKLGISSRNELIRDSAKWMMSLSMFNDMPDTI